MPLRLAWSGVDLFFVLSGFLIGGILYDAKNSGSYYRTFYGRRVRRIFPLYFIWLALFVVALHFVGQRSPAPLQKVFNRDVPVWSYPLFLQNFLMFTTKKYGALWLGATWSLAVEEQFYLLLPFMVRNLSYRGMVTLAGAAIVGAPVVRILLWPYGFFGPYALLPSRADALGFGVLLALLCRNQKAWDWLVAQRARLYWVFLLLGTGLAFLMKYSHYLYTLGLTWIAAFYAVLLVLTLVDPGRAGTNVFRSHFLMKLGTVSYAIYIFHQGINDLMHFAFFRKPPMITDWASLLVTLLSLVTVILLGALSWRFLEKPLIRRAHERYCYESSSLTGNTASEISLSSLPTLPLLEIPAAPTAPPLAASTPAAHDTTAVLVSTRTPESPAGASDTASTSRDRARSYPPSAAS